MGNEYLASSRIKRVSRTFIQFTFSVVFLILIFAANVVISNIALMITVIIGIVVTIMSCGIFLDSASSTNCVEMKPSVVCLLLLLIAGNHPSDYPSIIQVLV